MNPNSSYTAAPAMSTSNEPAVRPPPRQAVTVSYAHEIPFPKSEHVCYEGMINCIGATIGFFGSIPCCFCCPNPFMTVPQGTVGLMTRFGKYFRSVDPGLYFVNICSERIRSIDIKIQVEDIPRQMIMTKDNVGVNIDSVLYWHITDPYVATFMVSDVRKALIERTMTTLRQTLGTRTLQDAIENRDAIAHEIEQVIGPAAISWGVKIESILIKDLQFAHDLQESLSAAAKQKRLGESKIIAAKAEGESKVISAQAEVQAARLMREAADILNTPAAMQIRYLETLQNMAASGQAKVIFMPGAEGTVSGPGVSLDVKGKKPNMSPEKLATYEYMANQ